MKNIQERAAQIVKQLLDETASEPDVQLLRIISDFNSRRLAILHKLLELIRENPAYRGLANMIGDIISKQRVGEGMWDRMKGQFGDWRVKRYAQTLRNELQAALQQIAQTFGMPQRENVVIQLIRDNAVRDAQLSPDTIAKFDQFVNTYRMLIETLDLINTTPPPKADIMPGGSLGGTGDSTAIGGGGATGGV